MKTWERLLWKLGPPWMFPVKLGALVIILILIVTFSRSQKSSSVFWGTPIDGQFPFGGFLKWGILSKLLVFVNGKIPSFEMDENWGVLLAIRKPPFTDDVRFECSIQLRNFPAEPGVDGEKSLDHLGRCQSAGAADMVRGSKT